MPHLSELRIEKIDGAPAFGLVCLLAQSPALVRLDIRDCASLTEMHVMLLHRKVQTQLWYRCQKPIVFNNIFYL